MAAFLEDAAVAGDREKPALGGGFLGSERKNEKFRGGSDLAERGGRKWISVLGSNPQNGCSRLLYRSLGRFVLVNEFAASAVMRLGRERFLAPSAQRSVLAFS